MAEATKLKVLSLGWGVQSFTLAALVALGKLEPIDYAVHADTSYESSLTYAFAEKWTGWLEERGVKVVTLKQDNPVINKYGAVEIPTFTSAGQSNRQCTTHWKVISVRRFIASELKRRGLTKKPESVEMLIGISTDEWCRAKPSDVKYIKKVYPLLTELGMSRNDCKKFLLDNGLEVPSKSSCVFCPFHNKKDWQFIKSIDKDWQKAVEVDRSIRNVKGKPTLWIHNSRIPLEDVDLRTPEEQGQISLSDVCSECWL